MDIRVDSIKYDKILNQYKVVVLYYKNDKDPAHADRYEAFVEPSNDNSDARISSVALSRATEFFIKNNSKNGDLRRRFSTTGVLTSVTARRKNS